MPAPGSIVDQMPMFDALTVAKRVHGQFRCTNTRARESPLGRNRGCCIAVATSRPIFTLVNERKFDSQKKFIGSSITRAPTNLNRTNEHMLPL